MPSKIYHPSTIRKVQNKKNELKKNSDDSQIHRSNTSVNDHSYLSEIIPKKDYLKALESIKNLSQIFYHGNMQQNEK